MLRYQLAAGDRYGGPALFIAGGHSQYVQPGDHATIRTYFPSARIEAIPESGHNPHMEAREKFAALVGGFC